MKKLLFLFLSIALSVSAFAKNSIGEENNPILKIEKVQIKNQQVSVETVFKQDENQVTHCIVTITVTGPLGEPLGTYTGESYISCSLALQYALNQLNAALLP
jgi:hypothetical protein